MAHGLDQVEESKIEIRDRVYVDLKFYAILDMGVMPWVRAFMAHSRVYSPTSHTSGLLKTVFCHLRHGFDAILCHLRQGVMP